MRHLVSLALVYAVVVVLVLPGSLLAAQDEAQAPGEDTAVEQPAQGEPAAGKPGAPAESPAPEQAAGEPAPPPQPEPVAPTAPAQEETVTPAPAEPAEKTRARPVARKAQSGSVTITDFEFSPASIAVSVGDTVTWTNNGPTAHSATASDGSFDTGTFPRGQSRSHTFDAPGTFSYICTPHPFMKGSVTVRGASAGGGSGSAGGSDAGGAETSGSSGSSASDAGGSGASLPNSGADASALALLGLLLVALGVATRRRVVAQAPA